MKRKLKFFIIPLILIIIGTCFCFFRFDSKTDLLAVKSQAKLKNLYNGNSKSYEFLDYVIGFATLPWSFFDELSYV